MTTQSLTMTFSSEEVVLLLTSLATARTDLFEELSNPKLSATDQILFQQQLLAVAALVKRIETTTWQDTSKST